MRIVYPDYYYEFECAAGDCPDTCCQGWKIIIDDESLERYEQYVGHFSGKLQNSIDWTEGSFLQDECKRCRLLNSDNLCEMVLNMGEDHLCSACEQFPRHVEEFEGLREWSLGMSCPVAAKLILERSEPVHFIEERNDDDDPLIKEFADFDFLLFTELEDARQVIYAIIQNREVPIGERVNALMQMSKQLQICVEENRISDMRDVVNAYAGEHDVAIDGDMKTLVLDDEDEDILDYGESLSGINISDPLRRYEFLQETFSVFNKLERISEDWQGVIDCEKDFLSKGLRNYAKIRSDFVRKMYSEPWWPILHENLLMYFVYTYFCGAVYDDWIDTKLMLGVFSLVFIEEFIMNLYCDKGDVSFDDCVNVVYRYIREVEHSDNNLNTLEAFLHGYLFSPA